MFPQKRLKARFGATDGPFSSASCPPAEILSIPPAFVQAAWGSPHAWRTPCGARSHSARSSVSLLCNHFPEGKQGREHTLLISLKLHLKHTQSWVEGLGTTLLGAGFLPLNTHRAHFIGCSLGFMLLALPTWPIEDSGFLVLAVPFWSQDQSLVKTVCYLPSSAWDWELPEQGSGKNTTSWQNTENLPLNTIGSSAQCQQSRRKEH